MQVLLLDKHNYHTFQPLLYQVATGGLEADNIVYPVRKIFRKMNKVFFRMAEVNSIDQTEKMVHTNIGNLTYDYLVLAMGSTNNYFDFEPVKDHLLTLKSLTDAFNIRSQIMQNLERALIIENPQEQEEAINIAIIGGGPAGLELAGAIAEMKRYVLPRDFPELDLSRMHIYLFEASPRLLPVMSEESSDHAYRYLENLGIIIKTSAQVNSYDGSQLILENGDIIRSDTVIWTAGVKPVMITGIEQDGYLSGKRIQVDAFNRVLGNDHVFAIGDVSACGSESHPKGLPMLAPVAIQQAARLSENFRLLLSGKPMVPFVYKDKGVMATIGRKRAVVDLPKWKFQGLFAWFVWMFIHIMSLIGFRNKLRTLLDWSGSYFNYEKPLGIIIPEFKKVD